jgi:hypothetical protein
MRKEYEPGQKVIRGDQLYEADCWGKLHPVSRSKAYQMANKSRMIRMRALERAETLAFQDEMEQIGQERGLLPAEMIKVVA